MFSQPGWVTRLHLGSRLRTGETSFKLLPEKHLHLLVLQIDRCHRVLTIRGSPYQIFVRELVAMDGSDASEILLIDSIGDHCSDNIHNFKFRAKMSGLKFFNSQAAQQTPVSCRG